MFGFLQKDIAKSYGYSYIIFTFEADYKITIMDWLAFPLRDILVWFFENVLEKLDNLPNYAFILFAFSAIGFWVKTQIRYNAEAKANPDQIK